MPRTLTFRHRLEYGLYRAAEGLLGALPWRASLALGRGLGRMLHALDPKHRRIVRDNLRNSNLGLDEAEIHRVAGDCFAHFGALLLSTMHLLHLEPEALQRLVRIEGLEHWDAAAAKGKGFIGLTGHYGNWEAMALALSASGRTLAVIGRELDNPLLEKRLKALRGRFGNQVILKDGAFRDALKVLKQGRGVGFLLDQDALTIGLFVRFLGQWASTFQSAGVLAVKYGLPVVPIHSRPEPDGSITVIIEPALEFPQTGDTPRDVWTATQRMTQCIEAWVREEPRFWFWLHRRFKTRPGEGNPLPAPLPPPEWLQAFPDSTTRG